MHAMIHLAGIAAAIPEKAGEGIMTARRKFLSKDVAGGFNSLSHVAAIASGLLAADLITPQ